MAKTVWYSLPDCLDDERFKLSLAGEVDITRPFEQEGILEQCAEDFWHRHNGWECSWPKKFSLFASETSDEIASGMVDMEMEPRFSFRNQSST